MEHRKFYEISEETFKHFQEKAKHFKGVPGWEHKDLRIGFLDEDDGTYSAVLIRVEDEILDSHIFRFHFI